MGKATFVYKTCQYEDGSIQEIPADVHYLGEVDGAARPIALYFHGGSFVVGSKELLPSPQLEKMLNLGFVVVSPDYRLGPTISAYDGAVTDCKDSYQWAVNELPTLLKEKGILVDNTKIVTIGHSCGGTLALLMASMTPAPRAIADFFGFKYFDDPSYHTPSAAAAKLPSFPKDFLDQVYKDNPPQTATPPPFGPDGPDFSSPRVAWMIEQSAKASLWKALVPDGRFDKIDPVHLFERTDFPATVFAHGTADTTSEVKFSRRAHEQLRQSGIKTVLLLFDNGPHGFDLGLKPGVEGWELVSEVYEFLKSNL